MLSSEVQVSSEAFAITILSNKVQSDNVIAIWSIARGTFPSHIKSCPYQCGL